MFSGPLFKSIEAEIYKNKHFIKHIPVSERPLLINQLVRPLAKYYSSDYTSFEASFASSFMKVCECELYKYMLPTRANDVNVICRTLVGANLGTTSLGVKFNSPGRRMSGDMCTSLGNGFSNLMLWSFFCERNGALWDGYVEGDDGIFAVYSGEAPSCGDFAELGFKIKLAQHEDPSTASFCGVITSGDAIIRDPIDFIANFGWTSSFLLAGKKIHLQLLRAKALSATYETPQCPIVGALARHALSQTRGVIPRYVDDGYHYYQPKDESKLEAFSPSNSTRELFARLYGITADHQIAVEQWIVNHEDMFDLPLVLGNVAGQKPYAEYWASYVEVP